MQYQLDKMKPLKILMYDLGLFTAHAIALGEAGNMLKYYTPWPSAYPSFDEFAPGIGFPNVEKILYFWNNLDWCDMVFIPEVGLGDIADQCRRLGKPTFGSSIEGDSLEQNRELMRKIQKRINLPVQQTDLVKGIPALREFLKNNPDKYVKTDIFRKEIESFYCRTYDEVKLYLDTLEVALGPFSEEVGFMVEEKIGDSSEPGYDCLYWGNGWVTPQLWGFEVSKTSYLGKYVDVLPPPLKEVQDALTPLLKKIKYRGAQSVEIKVTRDGKPYLLDICSRFPAPLSTLYTLSIKNYTEVLWNIANGKEVKIEPLGKYVAALPLSSSVGEEQYVELDIPEKYKKYVKVRTATMINNKMYSVKGNSLIYLLVACSDDYNKLIEFLIKLSTKVHAFKLDLTNVENLKQAGKEVEKMKEFGMGEF